MSTTPRPIASDADALAVDAAFVIELLRGFIADGVRKVGFERVIVGLSGGVDSSLVTALAVSSLGAGQRRRRVHAVSEQRSAVADRRAGGVRQPRHQPREIVDITPAGGCLLRALSRCGSHPQGQQDGARTDVDSLRPLDGGARPGARHLQQDRVAARVRHALRRHGERAQPDRRPVQDTGVCARSRARAAAQRAHQTAECRSLGRAVRRGRAGDALRGGRRRCSICSSTSGAAGPR